MRRPPLPEAAPSPGGVVTPSGAHGPVPPIERLTLRLDDLSKALGVSRRAIERERSAGRFPRPDLALGRMPLWRVETIRRWVEEGGRL